MEDMDIGGRPIQNTIFAKPELKRRRVALYTQEEMVDMIKLQSGRDMLRATYAHIENGDYGTRSDIALVIARVLDAKVTDLFETKGGDHSDKRGD